MACSYRHLYTNTIIQCVCVGYTLAVAMYYIKIKRSHSSTDKMNLANFMLASYVHIHR